MTEPLDEQTRERLRALDGGTAWEIDRDTGTLLDGVTISVPSVLLGNDEDDEDDEDDEVQP